ncbi:uncharacterized protein F4812DRAFT_456145 [Daldinia caldariorum]|uniref:uncharacterized protein n=1 Tax=Daldinia caldariorum TaxID=326644 RepID=UPI002008498E|nr:uncharacterized protein F4812DRAFT_456145 [Daldinia caldariorum]KAI1472048.1 hypothetical protein F4812DRAFT_456145 [Daldinia caldariorum]
MAEALVLRFPISGTEKDYFLLNVCSNGSRPLDLKLVGSESTAVFTMKLRHKRTTDYKASSGLCSNEEWEGILTSTFVDQKPTPDIEIRADIPPDRSSVSISFRKNIQGITQRLGSIKLEDDDKTEISPFDWCISAIGAREKVEEDLLAANHKIQSLENSLGELKDQLDELIKAKDDDETQLLEKFRDLINEKKVKIRQQQRLLASASVDPEKLANVHANQSTRKHVPKPSRASKRKVKEEESSDDEFEKMDVKEDGNGSAQPDMEEDQGDTTAGETASGADTDEDPAPPPIKSQRNQAAVPTRNTRASASVEEDSGSEGSQEKSKPLPPPRRLPFMKNRGLAAPTSERIDEDETESDDEL